MCRAAEVSHPIPRPYPTKSYWHQYVSSDPGYNCRDAQRSIRALSGDPGPVPVFFPVGNSTKLCCHQAPKGTFQIRSLIPYPLFLLPINLTLQEIKDKLNRPQLVICMSYPGDAWVRKPVTAHQGKPRSKAQVCLQHPRAHVQGNTLLIQGFL